MYVLYIDMQILNYTVHFEKILEKEQIICSLSMHEKANNTKNTYVRMQLICNLAD